jgi:protein-tyrosine phosphatase
LGASAIEPYRILFVCLGNICRSPTAEGVLRALARREAPDLAIDVDSAGTGGYHLGEAPDARSQRAARARGIEISDLRARRVAIEDFSRFDLILAMDRENLRALEAMRPKGTRAQVALFLECAGIAGDGEVPDPYMGDAAGFERVLDLVTQASKGILARLRLDKKAPLQ